MKLLHILRQIDAITGGDRINAIDVYKVRALVGDAIMEADRHRHAEAVHCAHYPQDHVMNGGVSYIYSSREADYGRTIATLNCRDHQSKAEQICAAVNHDRALMVKAHRALVAAAAIMKETSTDSLYDAGKELVAEAISELYAVESVAAAEAQS